MNGWDSTSLADKLKEGKIKITKDSPHRFAVPSTNMEQASCVPSLAEKKNKRLDTFGSPVSLLVVSYRHRLCDSDGISAKAAIDGLTLAGILENDSPEIVKEVRYEQHKIESNEQEKTIIQIKELE